MVTGVFVSDKSDSMVTKSDKILCKMTKTELRQIVKQYETLTDNLRYQVLLLKYEIFLETPSLAMKIPVSIEETESDDFPDIPTIVDPNLSIKKKDVMFQ